MENQFKEIIHYATLAPSGHNTQPQKFSIKNNSILIYPDYSRRLLVVDPDDHALFISLGCALENLIIAANHMGYSAKVECFPPNEEKGCIRVTINKKRANLIPTFLMPSQIDKQPEASMMAVQFLWKTWRSSNKLVSRMRFLLSYLPGKRICKSKEKGNQND